jgi:thiol-disulfide isomerase/thioredoxin
MRIVWIAAGFGLLLAGAVLAQDSMMSAPKMMMSAEPANVVAFTGLEAAQMLAEQGPTVLFFNADWCPTCRVIIKELNAEAHRLGDVTVVVVDYDRSSDLKRRYGVTYQHTYVQIDAKGKKLALWSGGGIDNVLKNAMRAQM